MHIGDYWIHIVNSLQLAHYPTKATESTAAEWSVCDKFLNGEVTNPVISQVCSPDTGDMFYMLHQRGEGGAMTLATL